MNQYESNAVAFFTRQGCSNDEALKLARAERDAASVGIDFKWIHDEDGCGCELQPGEEPHEDVWDCYAMYGSKPIGSLSGICGPSDDYQRVVEAQLASEALIEIEKNR